MKVHKNINNTAMQILKILSSLILLLLITSCASENKTQHITSTNIAVLMPITGENGKLGQRLSTMIEAGLNDALEGNIKVVTYDISEKERFPAIAAKLKARGTKLVLGPIFSANTQEIVQLMQPDAITTITLSNNPALASQNVFVFGHTPMKQTQRIISYMIDKGYKDFIVLLPANKYAREINSVISNMVQEKGYQLVGSEFYSEKQESIDVAIQNITAIVDSINESPDSHMKPVIYISDDTYVMKDLMNALKKHNLDIRATLIGDDKIDVEYDQPTKFLFTGSIIAYNDPILSKNKNILGVNHLTSLDLVAYDLGKITSYNLGQDLTPDQFLSRLNSGHLYQGVSGLIKFVSGVADRKYDIIMRDNDQYNLIDEGK